MKLLFRFVVMDIKQGTLVNIKLFALELLMIIATICRFTEQYYMGIARGRIEGIFSLGDLLVYFFKGVRLPVGGIDSFDFPELYMVMLMLLFFFIGDYAQRDILGYGKSVLIRSKNKKIWWLSKCAWCINSVLIYFVILIAVTLIACVLCKANISIIPTNSTQVISGINMMDNTESINDYVLWKIIIIQPFIAGVGLCCFQMAVGFITSAIAGFVINIIIIVLSVFYMNPLLLGNSYMIVRNSCLYSGGINTELSLVIGVCIAIISLITGYCYFLRMDII